MRKIPVIIILACIGLFWNSGLAYSAIDVFLKIDGIPGESTDDDHRDEIELLAWSWQMSATGASHSGGSRAIVRPLIVTKYVDKASPLIFLALLNGSHVPEATLVFRKAGARSLEYLKIKMYNVQFVNISHSGASGEDRLTESVALFFSKVCYEYTPQKVDGSADAPIERCWDIEQNTER